MTNVVTQSCSECGAEIYGTKFCESCGARAVVAAEAPKTISAAPQPPVYAPSAVLPQFASSSPRGGTSLRAITLVLVLTAIVVMAILSVLPSTSNAFDVQRNTLSTLQIVIGFFALLAAVAGKASGGSKVGGALFALGYVILAMIENFTPLVSGVSYAYNFVDATLYLLLFLSWGVSRPFRGPGYFGILILIALEFVNFYTTNALYRSAGTTATIWVTLVTVVLVLGVVGFSALLERQTSIPSIAVPAQMGGPSNGKARSSLTLALGAIGVNIVSRLISGQLGIAISVCALGMLIAAIIVGHLARREIRVTNQRGRGLALTGLLIGYICLGINAAIILVAVVAFVAIGSNY